MVSYLISAVGFYFIAGDQLYFRDDQINALNPDAPIEEIIQGKTIQQWFTVNADEIQSISLLFSTYNRVNTSHLRVRIIDESKSTVGQIKVLAQNLEEYKTATFIFEAPVKIKPNQPYELVIDSPDGVPGNAIAIWYGRSVTTARNSVDTEISENQLVRVNGEAIDGKLCFQLNTRKSLWFGQYYWYLITGCGMIIGGYFFYTIRMNAKGRNTLALRVIGAFYKYGYLMRQLVSRDFKSKYKRSVLGVLWSFLNPLLTMMVQYVVFSTLFRSGIPNFALYLLIGIVCYSFFNESASMTLFSIVGNASLITKVYVPKYIYPIARTISSTINLVLSLVPLFAVMLITRTPLRPSILLLPFGLLCLFVLSLGIGMLLSTLMVFFRDTQFIWGVVGMLWMYATPIFYPESIIPERLMTLYKCNPLYHIIRFIRTVIINGISPEPKAYLLCILTSIAPLLVGVLVFKKNQDKFVLNL